MLNDIKHKSETISTYDVVETQFILKNAVIKKLKACSITPTQQRVEIAQILFEKPQHLSAEQVLAKVNGHAAVSKATVYNTLGLFARKGLIREVIVDPSKVFYDSNIKKHHHFYNLDTGALIDIDVSAVDLQTIPQLPIGTETAGVDIIIRVRNTESTQ
ncbi:MAG: Fur family transcriptional regulator [Thiohalomonadales bacterium]